MSFSPLIDELINALRCLPSVGPKSAQRMAFQLLQHRRDNALKLAKTLERALENVAHSPNKRCVKFAATRAAIAACCAWSKRR